MPEQPDTSMDDYLAQVEQHDFIKRQGIEAYAEMIITALADKVDEDKKILIKQGLTEMMAGPPRFPPFPPARLTPLPEVDAEFINPIFEENIGSVTRIWDWACMAEGCTHCERTPETVTLFYFDEILIVLRGDSAESFWQWNQSVRKAMGGGRTIRVRRRSGRNPRGSRKY